MLIWLVGALNAKTPGSNYLYTGPEVIKLKNKTLGVPPLNSIDLDAVKAFFNNHHVPERFEPFGALRHLLPIRALRVRVVMIILIMGRKNNCFHIRMLENSLFGLPRIAVIHYRFWDDECVIYKSVDWRNASGQWHGGRTFLDLYHKNQLLELSCYKAY